MIFSQPKSIFVRKRVGVKLACGVCQGVGVELTCPFARVVWFSSPFGLRSVGTMHIPLKDW